MQVRNAFGTLLKPDVTIPNYSNVSGIFRETKITDIHSVCTILANFIETAPFSGCFILSVTTTQRIKGRPYMSGLPF
jgi:hypothetical protein